MHQGLLQAFAQAGCGARRLGLQRGGQPAALPTLQIGIWRRPGVLQGPLDAGVHVLGKVFHHVAALVLPAALHGRKAAEGLRDGLAQRQQDHAVAEVDAVDHHHRQIQLANGSREPLRELLLAQVHEAAMAVLPPRTARRRASGTPLGPHSAIRWASIIAGSTRWPASMHPARR